MWKRKYNTLNSMVLLLKASLQAVESWGVLRFFLHMASPYWLCFVSCCSSSKEEFISFEDLLRRGVLSFSPDCKSKSHWAFKDAWQNESMLILSAVTTVQPCRKLQLFLYLYTNLFLLPLLGNKQPNLNCMQDVDNVFIPYFITDDHPDQLSLRSRTLPLSTSRGHDSQCNCFVVHSLTL